MLTYGYLRVRIARSRANNCVCVETPTMEARYYHMCVRFKAGKIAREMHAIHHHRTCAVREV